MAHAEKYTLKADDGTDIIVDIIQDASGWHWEVATDFWNEVQLPDQRYEDCIADFHENMRVFVDLGVTYSEPVFKLSKKLLEQIKP